MLLPVAYQNFSELFLNFPSRVHSELLLGFLQVLPYISIYVFFRLFFLVVSKTSCCDRPEISLRDFLE